ncbi:MAG: acyloxyacyl hydrolase [Desulfoprunum sp.]
MCRGPGVDVPCHARFALGLFVGFRCAMVGPDYEKRQGPVFYTPTCTRITRKTLLEMKLNPNSQASLGFRYAIQTELSLDVECMFHHVSNAGLGDRNTGINGVGFAGGVTCYWE